MKTEKVHDIIELANKLVIDKFPEYANNTNLLKACLNGFIYAQELHSKYSKS